MSTHQPQPLIWLARSPISSWVDFGSGEFAITMLVLANRLANLAPSSLPNMLKRGSMALSSLVVWTERTRDAGNPVLVTTSPGVTKRRGAASGGEHSGECRGAQPWQTAA